MPKINHLFLAMAIPEIIDIALTYFGQSQEYWKNYRLVNEGSPARLLLVFHPAALIVLTFLWLIFFYIMIKRIRSPWNLVITLIFVIAHCWGAATWISNWYFVIGYFIFIAFIEGILITKHFNLNKN